MKKTLIVGAFPCCGKTHFTNKSSGFLCLDSDYSSYVNMDNCTDEYIKRIKDGIGNYDFIFVSYHINVFAALADEGLPFVYVSPNNSSHISTESRRSIKCEWFGRFALRDNSHVSELHDFINTYKDDVSEGIRFLSEMYDSLTSTKSIEALGAKRVYLLKQGEYIEDIIPNLILDKVRYSANSE